MEALIRQSAQQRKLSATPAQIDRFLERTLDQLAQRYGGEQGLAAELKRVRGWTLAEYRGVLRSQTEVQVLREKLAESLVPASAVTETHVAERYAARKESFSQPDRVRVSHILIRRPSEPAQAAAALARAERTLARIVEAKGANFDALAAQLSEDEVTAKVGGKITTDIMRGAHPFGEGFETAVFGGEPGIIPQVVTSSMGHHIFRLDRKTPGRTLPLEEVKGQIRASLLAERRAEKLDEHLIAVRARADVAFGRY
jgi:peptidyl-prolyl cis-trans isomerase C